MSNYHHDQIEKLEDFRHQPIINFPRSAIRKHLQGFNQGSAKYEAPSRDKRTGPIVMGGARYDTYQTANPGSYGTPVVVKEEGCMERCCACLGKVLCCMCLCDMLT